MWLPTFTQELRTYTFNTQTGVLRFDFVCQSVGILNKGSAPVTVYFSESNLNAYTIVDANSYAEFSVATNYLRFAYNSTGTYDLRFDVVKIPSDSLNAPRFPNLYVQDINGNYVLYNPLTTDGFFTETYSYGSGLATNRPYNSETMLEVDYWFNGVKLSSTDGTFSSDIFSSLIQNFITSSFPFSDVNDVLRPLPGGQTTEVIQRIRTFWEQLDRPINDEYVGGWAKLSEFNRKLNLLEFVLDSGDKIEFPFTLLGFNIENLDSTPSQVRVYNDSTFNDYTVSTSYIGNLEPATRFEVLSGKVKLSFTGYLVRMIDFAPIVNIYYPIGFDETSGQPNDAYTLFLNELTKFENNLANAKFTGRVFKYKWVQHVPETRHVWDADYYDITFNDKKLPLPFEDVRLYLKDWYMYSEVEKKILSSVWDENYSVLGLYGKPSSINDVINNDNIVFVLGQNFSVYPPGTQRRQAKREFLKRVLYQVYLGNYAGSLTSSLA